MMLWLLAKNNWAAVKGGHGLLVWSPGGCVWSHALLVTTFWSVMETKAGKDREMMGDNEHAH